MSSKSELEQTYADMCVLYELALASGSSLDLHETCSHFLSVLSSRKGFTYCGVWLRSDTLPDPDPSPGALEFRLVYGTPRSRIGAPSLPVSHPAWQHASSGPFSQLTDEKFAQITPGEGVDAVFPLHSFGMLTLRAGHRQTPLDPVELAQLASVVRSFASAIDRCLTHERLVLEVAEREQAQRENQAMQAQLRHGQKLEAVGRLAGGIAHDFNNLLMSMLSTVELMQLDVEDPQMLEDLADIETAGLRATELTRQLLTFARPGESKTEAVNLDELVLEVAKLLRRTFDRNIELETRVSLGGRKIQGTGSALHTVLMNLAINARDAMPEGGALIIETDAYPKNVGEKLGEVVALRVRDTGQGMPAKVRDRIFDPFFTTKERGRGTGLGLATVYNIVKSHGGEIRVTSEPGEGTTFELLLPLLVAESLPAQAAAASSSVKQATADHTPSNPASEPRRGGLILLVDDGEGPRPTTAAVLERLGYEVTLAQTRRQTLELADAHSGLHAALINVRELGETEFETLKQLRGGLPTLPVVMLTPFPETPPILTTLGMTTRLTKSFGHEQLKQAIGTAHVAALARPRDLI